LQKIKNNKQLLKKKIEMPDKNVDDADTLGENNNNVGINKIVEQELLHSYSMRPNLSQKFRTSDVKKELHKILEEHLTGVEYNSETCQDLSKKITTEVKAKLKTLNYDRYKFIVQCVIGEQKGAGINMSGRCFWDSDTDNYAETLFMNENLFAAVSAYAVYYY
jgi:tctex1 domain-containing protein 2